MSKSFKIITLVVIPMIVAIYILFLLPSPEPIVQIETGEQSVNSVNEKAKFIVYDPNNPDYYGIDAFTADGDIASDTIIIGQNNVQIETKTDTVYDTVPDYIDVQAYYSRLILPGISAPVYAFENEEHVVCYRSWGSYWKLINNIHTEKVEGYFPVKIKMSASGSYSIQNLSEEPVVDPDHMPSVSSKAIIPDCLPNNYYLLSNDQPVYVVFDARMNQDFRIFCMVGDSLRCYPCDVHGTVQQGSLPVDPNTESHYLLTNFVSTENTNVNRTCMSYPFKTDDGLTLTVIPANGGH